MATRRCAMVWRDTQVPKSRREFCHQVHEKRWPFAEICRAHGVSRKTGYKILHRYEEYGEDGLCDLSRAPHSHPNETPQDIVDLVLAVKHLHPTWGPKKIIQFYEQERPELLLPAKSTVEGILGRHGLVGKRKKRRRATPSAVPFASVDAPNASWSADFKGWFRVGDGTKCEPLTVTDNFSRYLLGCEAMTVKDFDHCRGVFTEIFQDYGMPWVIRTDNGPPFASTGMAGLSPLSVWFIKLGILPERIEPGEPSQNGRHERFHKTLQEETAMPPSRSLQGQRNRFTRFRKEFNHERPHEALGGKRPASVHVQSSRKFPGRVGPMEYPPHFDVGTVYSRDFRWRGHKVKASSALEGERVGLEPVDERYWDVSFGPVVIGTLDTETGKMLKHKGVTLSNTWLEWESEHRQ
jgi:transposase InsO family protein